MAKASYWQRGESLDYLNSTNAVIEANTIIVIGERIGVAGTAINPNELGSLHVEGVFEFPKTVNSAVNMGAKVYFDGNGITSTASGNTLAGYAVKKAEAADTKILVKLQG